MAAKAKLPAPKACPECGFAHIGTDEEDKTLSRCMRCGHEAPHAAFTPPKEEPKAPDDGVFEPAKHGPLPVTEAPVTAAANKKTNRK